MSPLEIWWTWTKASAELSDEPIPRDAVVLSGSFPGASIAEHIKMKRVIDQLWNAPDDAYVVEGDVYSILGPPKP